MTLDVKKVDLTAKAAKKAHARRILQQPSLISLGLSKEDKAASALARHLSKSGQVVNVDSALLKAMQAHVLVDVDEANMRQRLESAAEEVFRDNEPRVKLADVNLRAFSHDIRNPLAGIVNICGILKRVERLAALKERVVLIESTAISLGKTIDGFVNIELKQIVERGEDQGEAIETLLSRTATPLFSRLFSAVEELLKEIKPSGEDERLSIQVLNESVRQAKGILTDMNELLDKGELAIKREKVQLSAIVDSAFAFVRIVDDLPGATLQNLVGADISVLADGVRLQRVFDNLVTNTIKYAGRTATCGISAEAKPNAKYTEVRVSDNGPGVPPEDRERVFRPYFRLERDRQGFKGSGLGLFIVQSIVHAHRGTIRVESTFPGLEPPYGAAFVMRFPKVA